uniref:Uncharacterized protein n=1 Tax=Arundo donax TaxID=35708 RepID=A0A0A9FCF1_ARUDO
MGRCQLSQSNILHSILYSRTFSETLSSLVVNSPRTSKVATYDLKR